MQLSTLSDGRPVDSPFPSRPAVSDKTQTRLQAPSALRSQVWLRHQAPAETPNRLLKLVTRQRCSGCAADSVQSRVSNSHQTQVLLSTPTPRASAEQRIRFILCSALPSSATKVPSERSQLQPSTRANRVTPSGSQENHSPDASLEPSQVSPAICHQQQRRNHPSPASRKPMR
jgi:hypothetical protein